MFGFIRLQIIITFHWCCSLEASLSFYTIPEKVCPTGRPKSKRNYTSVNELFSFRTIIRICTISNTLPSNVLGESFVNDWRRFQVDIFVQAYLRERGFQTEKENIVRNLKFRWVIGTSSDIVFFVNLLLYFILVIYSWLVILWK